MKFCAVVVLLLAGCFMAEASPHGRIAGGEDAVLGQVPYQAILTFAGYETCGAVIIAERYALTALTCVCSAGKDTPWPPQMFKVSAGSVDLYSYYNGMQRITVEEITANLNYNELKTGLALLRLTESFVFNENVNAIPLATENPPLDAHVEISGWGRTTASETAMHRALQIGEAIVEPERRCLVVDGAEVYASNEQVLCLGHQRRQGICAGDIGGPAVYLGNLVGLGAEVLGECGSLLPERYISIAANREWILNQME